MVVSFFEEFLHGVWSSTPTHLIVELALLIAIFLLIMRKPEPIKKDGDDLTKEEEDIIIDLWKPKPLVPDDLPPGFDKSVIEEKIVTSAPTNKIVVDDVEAINLGVANFLGLNNEPTVVEACQKAIDHYAVGSCGPRQFYGTMDAHLKLEEAVAKWCETEDSVNYCFPFATTTSAIQAFAHNQDVVFIDEFSWAAVRMGSDLTRGKLVIYKHNDMADLRDKIIRTKNSYQRWKKCNRWVVAEGISVNDGSVIDLPTIVNLRHEFCLRIIIDETYSFGVLGKTGRGACEHFNVDRSDVEISIGSYGTFLGSLGGFTVSTKELCSHQRLSSHAYIFSASPPPYVVVGATKALEILIDEADKRIPKLRKNTKDARDELKRIKAFDVLGDPISPLIHLKLVKELPVHEENEILQSICDEALKDEKCPTFIVKSKFISSDACSKRPTIKIFISEAHSTDEIKEAIGAIERAVQKVIKE